MTPVQMQYIVRMVHKIKACMEKCEDTRKEAVEIVGHKRLDENTRITLTVVADPDAGFPAPLQSHGVGFTSKAEVADVASPAKLRHQHGRTGRSPFR